MTGFDVTDEALQCASFRLGGVVDDLESDFAVLRAQMDRLLGGGWSGGAAQSFAAGWDEWLRGYHDATAALRAMAELLGSTGTTYASAETSSLGAARSVLP